eukprot:377504-Amphidinium_carterae.1
MASAVPVWDPKRICRGHVGLSISQRSTSPSHDAVLGRSKSVWRNELRVQPRSCRDRQLPSCSSTCGQKTHIARIVANAGPMTPTSRRRIHNSATHAAHIHEVNFLTPGVMAILIPTSLRFRVQSKGSVSCSAPSLDMHGRNPPQAVNDCSRIPAAKNRKDHALARQRMHKKHLSDLHVINQSLK